MCVQRDEWARDGCLCYEEALGDCTALLIMIHFISYAIDLYSREDNQT